jgi:FkbM family methyltransferase
MKSWLWKRIVRPLSFFIVSRGRRRIVHTRINGYELLTIANEDVGREILFAKSFEIGETRFIQRFLSTSATCIDVGANIGYFSILMASGAPDRKVYSFEPIPLNAHLLRSSAALNSLENIEVIESAVGSTDGEVNFNQAIDSAYSSILDSRRKPVERLLRVPITSLDSFLATRSIPTIDFLKIDVEGAEELVIEGSIALMTDPRRRPKLVLMELFDKNLEPFGTNALAIVNRMKELGYTPFFVNETASITAFQEAALKSTYNVFFTPDEAQTIYDQKPQ